MTRYARSGSTQKHKKMPGAATSWSEFSKQKNSLTKRKGIFNRYKNSNNFPEARQKSLVENGSNRIMAEEKSKDNDTTIKSHENTNKPRFSSKAERRQHYMKRKFSDDDLSANDDELKFSDNGDSTKRRKKNKKRCYNCRQIGHVFADCPDKSSGSINQAIGVCFKCGSTDHTTSFSCTQKVEGFPFAKCFICKEQGHICRDCPQNTHGVYVKGGQCNLCGNVNHLKKDCPSLKTKREEEITATVHTIKEGTSIDEEIVDKPAAKPKKTKKPKVVKF